MATGLENLFIRYNTLRDKWGSEIRGNDGRAREQARLAAIQEFDNSLSLLLGRPLPKLSMALSPVQRALRAAASRDEATRIYDSAVAAAAAKHPKKGRDFLKKTKVYAKARDNAFSRLDKAYAAASGGSGVVVGSPAGAQNSGSGPRPNVVNSLVQSSGGSSGGSGQNWFLWAGVALLGWWFYRR